MCKFINFIADMIWKNSKHSDHWRLVQFKFVSNNLLIRTLSLLQFYILPFVAGGTIFSNLKCIVWMYNVHLYNFNYQLKKKNLTSPPHPLTPPATTITKTNSFLPDSNYSSSERKPQVLQQQPIYSHAPKKGENNCAGSQY